MDESFVKVSECFGSDLSDVIKRQDGICEIRIRSGRPAVIYILNRPYFVDSSGNLTDEYSNDHLSFGAAELRTAFARICSFSVYKHMNNITNGFVTVSGGHRVGVCGTAVVEGGAVRSVTDITCLNIRAAKAFPGCSREILRRVDLSCGVLICGSPSSGKTTILRDIARILSQESLKRVSVIDERMEIASYSGSAAGFDVGLSDVYSGYPKTDGMLLAVRTMSPEYIICDELTGSDCSEIMRAVNCGVKIIASAHCDSFMSAVRNISLRALMKTGAFGNIVFLNGNLPADISEIIDTEDSRIAKAFRCGDDFFVSPDDGDKFGC